MRWRDGEPARGGSGSATEWDEVFAEYLANVDLNPGVQAEGYPLLVDGFCYWTIETLPLNERQALACRLTDPEFVCLSETVREDLPEIAAGLTE